MLPKLTAMDTPKTRAEFELRLHSLSEKMRQGKMHAGGLKDRLEEVRLLPNGRIDMLSVNQFARLQANMLSNFSADDFPELADDADLQE